MCQQEIKVKKKEDVEPINVSKGFQVRRLITWQREGSEQLMLGIGEMDPGCEEHHWTYNDHPVEEVYYILKGTVTLHCDDKKTEVKEGEACYIPASCAKRKMREFNGGKEKAIFVYAMTPPLE
jgi:mannose-6-phosphate isomerase-like protein (cupin superfamily)